MNGTLAGFLVCGPFAMLFGACLVRAMATAQRETSSAMAQRSTLLSISYFLTAIALVGMVYLIFTAGAIGAVGFLLAFFMFVMMSDAEIRIAGARNRAQQVELLWLLALAVKSGRPLADEIYAYAEGTWGRRRRLLVDLAQRIEEGVPLTELAVPQGLIPPSASLQIQTGMISSSLNDSLQNAAKRATRDLTEDQFDATYAGGALVYPAVVIPITVLIVSFLMYYIIPKFKKIFDDFGTELPQPTILLVRITDSFVNYWYLYGLPLIYVPVGVLVFVAVAQYYGWRSVLQSIFGRWFIRWHSPDVMRALAQSIRQQVPLDEALYFIAKHPGPPRLRERLSWAIETIQEGGAQWQTLLTAGIVNHPEAVVLETAERTGNLPWALDTMAAHLEQRTAFRVSAFIELIRPILLIALALAIGFISFAMFLPLIKLINDLA